MFAETLYKVDNPEQSDPPAEFYQMGIEPFRGLGQMGFRVIEIHGYWDEETHQVIHRIETLKPDWSEAYRSIEEARQRYEQQTDSRVAAGFVHLFTIEIPSGEQVYRKLSSVKRDEGGP